MQSKRDHRQFPEQRVPRPVRTDRFSSMALRKRDTATGDGPRITPKKAKNALAVAKIIGPAVIPVVAPYVVRALSEVRDRYDKARAQRLGVPIEDLSKYSGRGGALHARISGAANAVAELRERGDITADDRVFADRAETTLRQLAAAVRAAEDRKSTRLNSSHVRISYAVFCLKKKNIKKVEKKRTEKTKRTSIT